MSVSFYKELSKLSRTKKVISLIPDRARFRIAKKLYDYQSSAIHGIDIVVPLQNDGLVCFVNTKDIIGWNIFFMGEYESGTNKVLMKYIKQGDVVIEAGADIGSETLLLSRIVGNGRVYGFEPNPYTFERLNINIAINDLTNVKVFDQAMGEKNGNISFHIYPKDFCNPGMSSKYMDTPITREITVAQKTLDSFVQEQDIHKVDFLKMDIQGAEMDMLRGAADTITRHKPIIFLEAGADYNDLDELYKELKKYNYNVYLIKKEGTELIPSIENVKDGNWLAIYEKQMGLPQ